MHYSNQATGGHKESHHCQGILQWLHDITAEQFGTVIEINQPGHFIVNDISSVAVGV